MAISKALGLVGVGISIFVGIIITTLMQYSNDKAVYLWYFFPLFLGLVIIDYILFWIILEIGGGDSMISKLFMIILHVSYFIAGGILFFAFFFAIYHPTANLKFEKTQNCEVYGMMSSGLQASETYSILYTKFKYKGTEMLGQACKSTNTRNITFSPLPPYHFLKYGEKFDCGSPKKDHPSYDLNKTSIARQRIHSHLNNLLSGEQRFRTSSNFHSSSGGRINNCEAYQFNKIKMPSWLCLPHTISHKDLIKIQDCYVMFYPNNDSAFQNAKSFKNLREADNSAMLTYEVPIYYDKSTLFYIIIFFYIPFLLSFSGITSSIIVMIKD